MGSMAAAASSSLLLAVLCILGCCCCSASTPAPFDVHAACPHIFTLSSLQTSPPPHDTLRVIVPWKVGFEQFVKFRNETCLIDGFSIQVFLSALRYMHSPRAPRFHFVLFGDGLETPRYDTMVDLVQNKTVDAVVADLTINSDRMDKVGFTVPYIPSSLVMLTPFSYGSAGAFWDFVTPFSGLLWTTLLAFFVLTGISLNFLENKNPDFHTKTKSRKGEDKGSTHGGSTVHGQLQNPDLFIQSSSYPPPDPPITQVSDDTPNSHQIPSPPAYNIFSWQHPVLVPYDPASRRRRLLNAFWFASLCVFQSQQGSVQTNLGRIVTVIWLFVMLIFNNSYTASLASQLAQQKQYPSIESFQALTKMTNISVGYQEGSFVSDYLNRTLQPNLTKITFHSETQYAEALKGGSNKTNGVAAIVDELPYVQVLLQSECGFTIGGSNDEKLLYSLGGFGFAFRKGDPMIDTMSRMILQMAEDGTLQVLKDGWKVADSGNTCSADGQPSHLRLKSFGGLFSIIAGVYLLCTLWRLGTKTIKNLEKEGSSSISQRLREISLSGRSNRICDESQQDQLPDCQIVMQRTE